MLPTRLQTVTSEDRRLATLLLCSIVIAELAVLVAALIFWRMGLDETARYVLLFFPVQAFIAALLYVNVSPRLCGHLLIIVFFLAVIWGHGADSGYGVLSAIVVPLAATVILGSRAGLAWTAIVALWCVGLWFWLADDDGHSNGVVAATAILSTLIGLGAWMMESTRVIAVSRAGRSLAAQQQAEAELQGLLDTTFPAHGHALGGVLTRVSPGVQALLGWEDEDLLGGELKTLLHPDDQHLFAVLQAADCGGGFRRELRLRHLSGQWVWSEVSGVRAPRTTGPTAGSRWLFVARNVEIERKSRDQLERARRLEGVGVMAAGLAHDFNNLIMVLRGFAELLPPSRERESILAAASEAGDLFASLLAFGRQDAETPDAIDLRAHILKWVNMLQRLLGGGIRLEMDLPEDPVWCAIPDSQLNQVLLNLVINAKHAMPRGGFLQIRLATLEVAQTTAGQQFLRAGQYASLAVIDDGVGMSGEVLAQALDPFFTTRAATAGSGLGLASVHSIVTALEGSVKLESTPGAGTSVLIHLPIVHGGESQQSRANPGNVQMTSMREVGGPLDATAADQAGKSERTR